MLGRISAALLVSIVSVALSSCGGGGGGSDQGNPCGDLNIRVTGGSQCRFERSPVVSVITLFQSGDVGFCSGTMVTVDDVLTAGHCFGKGEPIQDIRVYVDQTPYAIKNGAVHPRYNYKTGSPFDLAMLTIDGVLDIGPVPLILSRESGIGDSITVFGYGNDENNQSFAEKGPSSLKAGFMRIAHTAPGLFGADFDETGSAICQGDSGGPATQVVDGKTGIVGITSFTLSGCTTGSVSGFIDIQYTDIYGFILGYAPDVPVI